MTRKSHVWLLIGGFAAAAAATWTLLLPAGGVVLTAGSSAALWAGLTLAFVVTDANMVHLNVGRHAHSFTFSLVPLVIGLFHLGPAGLLSSRLLGTACALVILRRQPIKVAFNLAQLAVGIGLAEALWNQLGPHEPTSMRTWAAAVAALLVVGTTSSLAISAVIRLDGGHRPWSAIGRTLRADVATAVTQSALALVALAVIRANAWGLWAVGVIAGYVVLGQRAHLMLQKRHGALQRLNQVAGELGRDPRGDAIAQEIVIGAVRALDASSAELELVTGDNEQPLRIRYDGSRVTTWVGETEAGGRGDTISAALSTDDHLLGHLRVTGSTSVRAFGDDEQQLLHALAQHATKALTNGRLTDELRAQVAENEHQATHDPLTGLPNRLMFDRVVTDLLASRQALAALLLDLDRFKEVNDTLGHAAGDALLRDAGARLTAAIPEALCVARLGGDEFTILLSTADPTVAKAAAEAAREALLHPLEVNSVPVSVDASIGVAIATGPETTCDELLRHADVAMYAAKESRGAVAVYDPSLDHNDASRLALVAELRAAIASNALTLHYQPKVPLHGAVAAASVEALARWTHPTRGMIPPDEFIPVAEQTGVILGLTEWVITTALAQCREWLDHGLDIGVAVNLSPRVLRDATFPARLAELLAIHRVPASRLTLEITETAIMSDVANTVDVLWQLRRSGVRLSIDDLGVGESSLAYLKRLPVDEVKLDKSFVLNMADDSDDDAIVCAMVGLAHRLGRTVVAEGVETQRVRDRLVEIGCDTAQGYWYSRPIPAVDIPIWFAAQAEQRRAESRHQPSLRVAT